MGLLQNGRDTLVIGDAEKAELLNAAFALGQDQPAGISDLGDQGRGLLEGRLSLHQEDWVGEHPGKLDILKSMDPARNLYTSAERVDGHHIKAPHNHL